MYDMLRNMDPPLGFGNKCPFRLAYKLTSLTTLFALIGENLSIKIRPNLQGIKITVGKIYCALLILDNWRTTRFGKMNTGPRIQ
ncbi:voltage-dependent calcium channel type A subunit alpha-1, partial [Nephila pilipes]